MFFRKRSSPLAEARHTLSDVTHSISDVGHNLSERVQDTLRHAPEKLGELRETVGDAVSHVGDAVSHVREAVSAMEPKAEAVKSAVSRAQKIAQEQAAAQKSRLLPRFRATASEYSAAGAEAAREADESANVASGRIADRVGALVYENSSNKWLWLGIGVLVGVFIGLLLAPTSGRRSRALIKDKLNKGRHAASDMGAATAGKVADVGHKAQGLVHRVEDKVRGGADDADDLTIADRVRTALGQNDATRDIERLNIDVVDGAVTVRGPLVETAVREAIEAVVRGVKGVREVHSELLEDSEEDAATFVG